MASKMAPVYVVGVGMTKFYKPNQDDVGDYPELAQEAVEAALNDASVSYKDVKQACVGYVYGDTTCGQRILYEVGMTGIPVINVNNACSTGSTALYLARQLIRGGQADCVLAVGFEKMDRGSLAAKFPERTNPMDKHVTLMADICGLEATPMAAQLFGNAGREHMELYGTKLEHFAKIAEKNHRHAMANERSQMRDYYSVEEILGSKEVHFPLTKLQCCPTSDGAAAAVLCSSEFVKSRGLESKAVEILAQEMVTDFPSTFEKRSPMSIVGYDMTEAAAKKALTDAGIEISDIDVIELHDCFSANELITYEALGLCPPGKAPELIESGNNTYGGQFVVNPSGGLISKGHPLGATGLAQCAELVWQLRGEAGPRQVENAKLALQHNIGLGGAVVVTIYDAPKDISGPSVKSKL